MSENNTPNVKPDPNVTVARIGIIIALIGLIGTLGVAYFNYLSTKPPVSATQTTVISTTAPESTDTAKPQSEFALAESTFDGDDDGWLALGAGPNGITYESSGGNPGGFIMLGDDDGNSYWIAPEKFLGDKSAAYGGILVFDFKTTWIGPSETFDASDVILIGRNGVVLTYNADYIPGNIWKTYTVSLSESANWTSPTGEKAAQEEIYQVLLQLSELRIRGEFIRGEYDYGNLDNVIMLRKP